MEDKKNIRDEALKEEMNDIAEAENKNDVNQAEGAVPSGDSAGADSSEPKDELKELKALCDEYIDKYKRSLAEFDNFRKRTLKEKAGMYDEGVKETALRLLPVLDNLDRAIASGEASDGEDSLLTGVKMISKQLKETLACLEVVEIKALGESFNPSYHEAVAHEQNENYGENEIILEMLKGYMFKDKVLRPSMVKVAN